MDTEKKDQLKRKTYTSPSSKLITFFEGSRDKWKKKAKDAKYQIKLLRKKNKYLVQKKKELKEHSKDLETQLQHMKENEKRMLDEIDRLKKNLL